MKFLKMVVIALAALLLVAVRASPVYRLGHISLITLEEPCVMQGGLCAFPETCEPDNRPQMSNMLCPKQQHLGVVCCYL